MNEWIPDLGLSYVTGLRTKFQQPTAFVPYKKIDCNQLNLTYLFWSSVNNARSSSKVLTGVASKGFLAFSATMRFWYSTLKDSLH